MGAPHAQHLFRRRLVERVEQLQLRLGRIAFDAGEDRSLGVQREQDPGRFAPLKPGGADQQRRPPPLRIGEHLPRRRRIKPATRGKASEEQRQQAALDRSGKQVAVKSAGTVQPANEPRGRALQALASSWRDSRSAVAASIAESTPARR